MNFDFSEEQEQLRDQAKRVLTEGLLKARAQLDAGDDYDAALWQQLVELGWPAAAIAEEDGGLGLSVLELCVLAEETGRVLAPVPFATSVLHATSALQQVGGGERVQCLLAQLAAGERIASLAFTETARGEWTAQPTARVVDGRLSGFKTLVADAASAGFFIVSAQSGEDGDGFGWWLVEANAAGISRTPVVAIDRVRRFADVGFDNTPCVRLGLPGGGAEWADKALNVAAVLTAFEQLGAAESALALTLEYVKTRQAFNRPVASYQAVKHSLADLYVKIQLARSHCYYGAWALSSGPEALPRAAAGARLAAIDALGFAGEVAVELHGGIGFTWESDTLLFYRRARLQGAQLGGRAWWAQRLVAALAREAA